MKGEIIIILNKIFNRKKSHENKLAMEDEPDKFQIKDKEDIGKEDIGKEEYEIVELEILPAKIICPDCGGITLEGLEFCDKCGGEL